MKVEKYKNIGEAYYNALKYIHDHGAKVPVDLGSYEKELHRQQVPFIAFEIEYPHDFGWLADPHLPVTLTHDQIENYFQEYLLSADRSEHEAYRYGNRILESGQLHHAIMNLTKGFTNQAAIAIEKPSDILLLDPPCLRSISFNVEPSRILNMSVFWRSWDCLNGLPLNLSGLTKLLQFVVGFLEDYTVGSLYVAASNPHYYYEQGHDLVEAYLKGEA